jgi:hypothetical protein
MRGGDCSHLKSQRLPAIHHLLSFSLVIRCPETSVNNYHTTPRNIPEERRSQHSTMSQIQETQAPWS